jgi:hypothetical protein
MTPDIFSLDLTQRPPRGFRVRLGNYVILARILDKGRATLVGKNGDFEYSATMDEYFFKFAGIDADELLQELATGKNDGEILEWVKAHSKMPRVAWEIDAWSSYMEKRGPDSDQETIEFFMEYMGKLSKTRDDIKTWFEAIELDDYVTFGGKA